MIWWLVVIFIAAVLAPGMHRVIGAWAGWLLALVPAGVAACLVGLWSRIMDQQHPAVSIPWVPELGIALSLRLDGLSLLFGLLITGIGTLILMYAGAYLKGDARLGQLWMFLLLFMAAMLGLVLSENLLALFIFWELTSITSWLLIGFNSENEESRASALQALLITGGGGLVLLPGLLLLGHVGQSFEISALVENAQQIQQHSLYVPLLLLILVGAFTKSAQFPFHFWLPDAMAAPTPISAYLHSATMVKAGVYLLARLHPVLGGTAEWFWWIAPVGTITMLLGALLAIRATDLKQILAYATISVLGSLMMLLGIGTPETVKAALIVLIAHALYKGGLFMVAGCVDHAVHQRDVNKLSGLRSAMPATFITAVVAGLSMSAILPTLGFIAKEVWYEALGHAAGVTPAALSSEGTSGTLRVFWFLGASVVANMGLVAAVGLVCIKPFLGSRNTLTEHAHEGSPILWGPPAVLSLAAVILGLMPAPVSDLLSVASSAVAGQTISVKLALWHGVNAALVLSLLTLAGGIVLYWQRRQLDRLWVRLEKPLSSGPASIYPRAMSLLNLTARRQTAMLQNGYLRFYLLMMVAVTVFSVWLSLRGELLPRLEAVSLDLRMHELLLAVLILAASIVAVRAHTWLLAVGALGIVGYSAAGIYVLFGAPDLAMTQFVIETLSVILFVLAFSRLPDFRSLSSPSTRRRDAVVAIATGATITVLLLFAMTVRSDRPVSQFYVENSVTQAHGRNIVNVILVDFRALDTLGEITVLAIAAIGVYSLLTLMPRSVADNSVDASTASVAGFGNGAPTSQLASGASIEPDEEEV